MPSRERPKPALDALDSLMARVQRGDRAAFAELFERSHRRLHGGVLRIVGDEGTADDVLVEAFARAWQRAASFDGARGSVLAWLSTLAGRLAIDTIRKRNARPAQRAQALETLAETAGPGPDPGEQSEAIEQRERVQLAVAQLPERQRLVIEAAFYAGLSHTEVAEALGEALGTVKSRIRSGLIALRRALEPGEVGLQ